MPPKSSTGPNSGFDSREMTTTSRMSQWQKKNVKTYIVSAKSKLLEQRSIMAAVAQAAPYDRIEIEAGEYHELVSVTFPLEFVAVVGDHPVIVSRGTGFQTASECDCYVDGITFENRSKDAGDFAVVCAMGSPIFVNCKMSNVNVIGGSKPTLSSCDISDSASGVGINVQCLVAAQNIAAPNPTFDNCKIANHYRVAVVVDGVGTHMAALFRQCRINQVVGATAIACCEGVASSSVASRTVVFQENQISYKKSAVNERGEVELLSGSGVQTDYKYSAGVAGAREPACMWIGGCGKHLKLVDNDFSDGAVGLYLERGASPTMEGNKVRRMTTCGMRIAVGARGVGDDNHELNCGAQFERCAIGIDVAMAAEYVKPACQSLGAEEVGLLRPSIINELDQVAIGSAGAVPSHKWHDRLHNVSMDLTAKCNIPISGSSSGGSSGVLADATARAMPNWDVVQALAKMHHTDLGTPTGETDAAMREAVTTFLSTASSLHAGHLSLLSKVAATTTAATGSKLPGAVHITQAKFTDCQKHGVRFAPGSYGLLSYCSFDAVSHGAAILVERDAFPVVVNCRFSTSGRAAVECHRNSQAVFVHNIISNGSSAESPAIWMRAGSEGAFIGNKIEFNAGFGAIVEGAATPTFFRNQFASNVKGGLLVRDHARPTIDRNCFKANKRHIVVQSYSNPKIFCNDLFNGDVGVSFSSCAIGSVVGNAIFDNTEAGVLVETDADPRVEHNFLVRNVGHGVLVRDNGTGTLVNNLIVANSQYGVSVQTGGDCVCRGNTIGLNTVGGIFVSAEGLGLFEKNDVFSNQMVANIHLAGKHTNPVFDKNRIWRSRSGGGVVCDDGAGGHFKRNTIVCNGGCGVALYRGCVTLFEHNRIESQLIGVCASMCGGGVVRRNKICYNGRCGIFIDQLASPEIHDNAIDQNYCGLELRQSPAGLVKNNSFEGNIFGSISGQSDAMPNCVDEAGKRIGMTSMSDVRKYARMLAAAVQRPSVSEVVQGKAVASRPVVAAGAAAAGTGASPGRGRHHPSSSSTAADSTKKDEQQQQQDSPHGASRARSRPTSAADGRVDTASTCVITGNHLSFNAVCGVALVLCASGHYEKNSIVGNAFAGVYVTSRRAFDLHHLANVAFLKECHFGNAVEILAAHKVAPNFANEIPPNGVFGDAVVEGNVISMHSHAGVMVELLEHNTEMKFVINEIHQNAMGIRMGTAARSPGLCFEENDVTKNVVGLHISGTGSPSATFEDNLFDHNSFAGAILGGDCRPLFKRNNVFSNSRYFGAWVIETAAPSFMPGNVFSQNVVAGLAVQQGGQTAAAFNACVFKHNDRFGIFAYSFESHPRFDGNGMISPASATSNNNNNNNSAKGSLAHHQPTRGGNTSKISSALAAAHSSTAATSSTGTGHHSYHSASSFSGRNADASNSVSVFKNCIIRNNGLVGIFVGALSKEFSDDLNARGSIRFAVLVSKVSKMDSAATEAVLENFADFAGNLGETVTGTDIMQGKMSSPQTREREGAAEAVTHNAGPMALPNEAPKAGGSSSSGAAGPNQKSNDYGGKGVPGRPPHKGFVRGGSILVHQCAVKANRLGALVDRNADPVFFKTVFAGNFSSGIVLSPGSIACLNENVVESNALCGIVACPQARSSIIGCEVLENNKTELLELSASLDERMHPIGGVAALVSLDTVKFSESDLNFSPSRWSSATASGAAAAAAVGGATSTSSISYTLGINAEANVKKSAAMLSMVWVGAARADSRMAHRSAHHFSTPSKFRLSPGCLFSTSPSSPPPTAGGGSSSNLPTPAGGANNPRARQHSNLVAAAAAATTDQLTLPSGSGMLPPSPSSIDNYNSNSSDGVFGAAAQFDPKADGVPVSARGGIPQRQRSRSMVMIKTLANSTMSSSPVSPSSTTTMKTAEVASSSAGPMTGAPSASYLTSGASTSSSTLMSTSASGITSRGKPSSSGINNSSSTSSAVDLASSKLAAKFRLNSLVHGVGVWVEEGSDCDISHNTVFGHVNAGVLITTEGLTSDSRGSFESEMMAQTQATVAPGDRYSSALQEALAFVAGGVETSASTLTMNLIHHNRGVGVRIVAAASLVVDGLVKQSRGVNAMTTTTAKGSMTSPHGGGSRASRAAKDAKNDLLDPEEIADAPGCTATSVHPILQHITSRNAGLTVPALGSINVGVMDRVLCTDDVIGGGHEDAAKRSLARLMENEIEFNSNGGLLVEFVLCSAAAVHRRPQLDMAGGGGGGLDDTRRLDLMISDSLVPPTRVVGNTFRCNGRTGSIMVRSAVNVDMLLRGGTVSSSGVGWANDSSSNNILDSSTPDEFLIQSLLRASCVPGLARVSDFYMPCVIERNVFLDPPLSEHRGTVRAPCIALLGHTCCNIRSNEFNCVTSGCAIVVARDVVVVAAAGSDSAAGEETLPPEPRQDSIDPAIVSSGVIIGPDNTFSGNHCDVAISGTGLTDCAVVGNVFKNTTGVCVLATGGARPLILANRFHGQRFYEGSDKETDENSSSNNNNNNNRSLAAARGGKSAAAAAAADAGGRSIVLSTSNPTSTMYEPVVQSPTDQGGSGTKHVTNAANLRLKASMGKAWEKIIAPPLHGPIAAVTCTSRFTAPWIVGNQFDGNQIALRVTENGGALATFNVFSANIGCSVVVDDASSQLGGAVVERNLFCNSTSSSAQSPIVAIAGDKTRALIRRNIFRDILKASAAEKNSACVIRVGSGASPWIDSNGFQDVGIALLLVNPGKSCAVSRNAFFRCQTGVHIGAVSVNIGDGSAASSPPASPAAAAAASSPATGATGASTQASQSSPASTEAVLKSITSNALACLSHNAFECPLGTGVLVSGAQSADAAAVNSNVFLCTPFLSTLGGHAVACLRNIFIGASVTGTSADASSPALVSTTSATDFSSSNNNNNQKQTAAAVVASSSPSSPGFFLPPESDTALQVREGSRSMFLDNFVLGSKTGLLATKGAEAVILGGTFFKCTTAIDLSAEKLGRVLVDSCTVIASQSIALRLSSGAVKRCKIFKSGGQFAVDFCAPTTQGRVGDYCTMTDSEVHCSDNDAVRFSGSGALDSCSVSLAKHGVKFLGGPGAVADVRKSNVMDHDRVGILFAKGNFGSVIDSDVFDCGICGVALEDGASGDVEGCRISSTQDHGAVDMVTGTRVTMRANTIRNQFSPSHKGKLAGARQKETVARVNKELEEGLLAEEQALSNAKWAVSWREKLLKELSEIIKRAQTQLFDDDNNHRVYATGDSNYQQQQQHGTMERRNSGASGLPSVATTSPSRMLRNDRGFELSNIIAAKKATSAQKLVADQPVPRSNNNNNKSAQSSTVSSAANSRPSSSQPASNSTSARRGSLTGATIPSSAQPASRAAQTSTRSRKRDEEAVPQVATKTTAASRAKETEANVSVSMLMRGAGHYASEQAGAGAGGGGGGTTPSTASRNRGSANDDHQHSSTESKTNQEKPQQASSKTVSRTAPRRGSTTSESTTLLPPLSPATALPAFAPPTTFSRVLLHAVGDAEGSPAVAQVQQMLEETLGGRCCVMKTSASDPIEAMLSAAACSHVVVLHPAIPVRRRPTPADEKALLALSCYVEMALREKAAAFDAMAQKAKSSDAGSDVDSSSSRPGTPASPSPTVGGKKMNFAGAFSVVQPPPAGGADEKSPLGEIMLPPVKSPSAGSGGLGDTWSPSKSIMRLPPTFTEVQGAAGLYQALTGRKAPPRGSGEVGGDKGGCSALQQIDLTVFTSAYTLQDVAIPAEEYILHGTYSGSPCVFTIRNVVCKNVNVTASFGPNCKIVVDTLRLRDGTLAFHGGAIGSGMVATFKNLDIVQDDSTNSRGAFEFQPVSCEQCSLHLSDSAFSRTYRASLVGAYPLINPSRCSNLTVGVSWVVCLRPARTMTIFNNSFEAHGFNTNVISPLIVQGIHPINELDHLLVSQNRIKARTAGTISVVGTTTTTTYWMYVWGIRVGGLRLKMAEFVGNSLDFTAAEAVVQLLFVNINNTEFIVARNNHFKALAGTSLGASTTGPAVYGLVIEFANFTDEDGTGNGRRPGDGSEVPGNVSVANNTFEMSGKNVYASRLVSSIRGMHFYTCTDNYFDMNNAQTSGFALAVHGIPVRLKKRAYIARNYARILFSYFASFLYTNVPQATEHMERAVIEYNKFEMKPTSTATSYYCYFIYWIDATSSGNISGPVYLSHNRMFGGGSIAYLYFLRLACNDAVYLNLTNNSLVLNHTFSGAFTTNYAYYNVFLHIEGNVTKFLAVNNSLDVTCRFRFMRNYFVDFANDDDKRTERYQLGSMKDMFVAQNTMRISGSGESLLWCRWNMHVLHNVVFDSNVLDALEHTPFASTSGSDAQFGWMWSRGQESIEPRFHNVSIIRNYGYFKSMHKLLGFFIEYGSEVFGTLTIAHNEFHFIQRYPGNASAVTTSIAAMASFGEINARETVANSKYHDTSSYTPSRGRLNISHNSIVVVANYFYTLFFREDAFILSAHVDSNNLRINASTTNTTTYGVLVTCSSIGTYPVFVRDTFSVAHNFVQMFGSAPLRLINMPQLNALERIVVAFNLMNSSCPRYPMLSSDLETIRSGDAVIFMQQPTSSTYSGCKTCFSGCRIESNTILGPHRCIVAIGNRYAGNVTIRNNTAQYTSRADTTLDVAQFLRIGALTNLYGSAAIIVEDNFYNVTLAVTGSDRQHGRSAHFVVVSSTNLIFNSMQSQLLIRNNGVVVNNATAFALLGVTTGSSISCAISVSAGQKDGIAPLVLLANNSIDADVYAHARLLNVSQSCNLCRFGSIRITDNIMRVTTFASQQAPYLPRRGIGLVSFAASVTGGALLSSSSTDYIRNPPSATNDSQLLVSGNTLTWKRDPQMSLVSVAAVNLFHYDNNDNDVSGPGSSNYRFVGTFQNNSIAFAQPVVNAAIASVASSSSSSPAKVPETSFFLVSNSPSLSTHPLQSSTIYLLGNELDSLGAGAYTTSRAQTRFAFGNTDPASNLSASRLQIFVGLPCNSIIQIDAAAAGAERETVISAESFKLQLTGPAIVLPPKCSTTTRSITPPPTRSNSSELTPTEYTAKQTITLTQTLSDPTPSATHRITGSDEPNRWGKIVNTRSLSESMTGTQHPSRTHTISHVPPIATVGLSLEAKAQAATQAAAISMAASFAAPSAAMVAMRMVAVFDLMGCPEVNSDRERWNLAQLKYPATLPMFTTFGFGRDEGKWARGAVVGFIVAIVAAVALSLLGGVVLETRRLKAEQEASFKEKERRRHERFLLQQRACGTMNYSDAALLDDDDLLSDTSSERRMKVPPRSLLEGALRSAPLPYVLYLALSQVFFFWASASGMLAGLLQPKDLALGLVPLFSTLFIVCLFHYKVVDRVLFSKQGPRVTRSVVYYPKGSGECRKKAAACALHHWMRVLFFGFYAYQLPRLKNLSERELRGTYLSEGVVDVERNNNIIINNNNNRRSSGRGSNNEGSGIRSSNSSSSSSETGSSSDEDFVNDLEGDDDLEDILRKRRETVDLVRSCRGILTKFYAPLHKRELQTLEEEARMDLGMQTARQRSVIMTLAEEQMEEEEQQIQESWLLRCVHRETVLWKLRERFCPHFMLFQCVFAAIVGVALGFGRTGPSKYCREAARAVAFFNTLACVVVCVLRPYIVPSLNIVFCTMEIIGAICSCIGVFLIQEGRLDKESAAAVEGAIIYTVMIGSTLAGFISFVRVFFIMALRLEIVPRVDVFRRVREELEGVTMMAGGLSVFGMFADALF